MRLLITNDDGIDCVFLHELVRALTFARHELAVVAPQREQSWVGAGKSRTRPVRSAAIDRGFGCPTWVVDGTPSDCVNIALAHLLPEAPGYRGGFAPDAVVSGINIGLNASLGFILASGTVAGAWEGALHGLPGIAFSQDLSFELYDRLKADGGNPEPALLAALQASARRAAGLTGQLVASTARRSFIVHNVNFPLPCGPDTPVRVTVPARVVVPRLFSPAADDGTHRFVFSLGEEISSAEPLTDRAALTAGMISHTILDYTKLGQS